MIEKTSKKIKCALCTESATMIVGGVPYCDVCAQGQEAQEQKELVESFGETE